MSEIEPDAVESALDGLGLAWKKREGGWVVPATARTPCEVDVELNGAEVVLEAVLASWDEIGQPQREALRRLLDAAGGHLPGVWFMMSEQRASVVAAAAEHDLADAVRRVVAAARLLSREAGLLLEADIADRYLKFFSAPGERVPGTGRI